MSDWFEDLNENSRELVTQRWGTKEFADWTTSLLLGLGVQVLIRSSMKPAEQQRFRAMSTVRRTRAAAGDREPDLVDRLYDALHSKVSDVLARADENTGLHGTAAVQWLDREIQQIQASMSSLYARMTE